MPEPGTEDAGGNPLQEGILGDWQNRGVRDEAFASVRKKADLQQKLDGIRNCPHDPQRQNLDTSHDHAECMDCGMIYNPYASEDPDNPQAALQHPDPMMDNEPGSLTLPQNWASVDDLEFEVTDVIVPDPESIRPDKGQMDKRADFLGDLGDIGKSALPIAGGIAGGAVGALTLNPAGIAAGAAIGSGLGGAGEAALNGEGAGDIATQGLTDAAIGGIGGGLAGGAGLAAADTLGAGAGVGAATAEDAAATGATKGGIGSLMKSAWGKVPTEKIKNAYLMHSVMNDASGAAQPMTQPSPGMTQPGAQQMSPSFYSAVDTPTSHGEIPSNDTSDPEQVDFNEKNDGEKDGLQSDIAVNGIGGTDLGPDDFFSPDSGGLSSFAELLPKILQFALSDQSAAGDPDMEGLHQKLEAEKPGYMNSADDDHGSKIVMMIMKGDSGDEASGDDSLQDNDAPHDPISEHEATALRPGLETTCPDCGGVMDASTGHCPQCGSENSRHMPQPTNPQFNTPQQMLNPPMTTPKTAAGATSQGPVTDQQKAQVSEVLAQEGRAEEIPAMIMEPWNYADELAQITGQEEPPQDVGQPDPPPPVNPEEQQGNMPMPGMSPPGGSSSGAPMMAAVKKYAATVDGFCEHCPNCGSHSTGYLDYEEGDAGCKTCGHKWTGPKMVEHSAAGEDLSAAPMTPELSQVQPEGEQEETGSLGWTDESGAPLKVNQTYEMFSNNYDIPDRIKIDAVKPDVIEFTLVGEYGLSHRTELTHEEASVEGTSFVPAQAEGEPAPEEAGEGAQPVPGPGDQTDLSTPHEMMAARVANPESINLEPNWEGMRAFVLNMARTDPAKAAQINQEMGSEGVSPEELAQASGASTEALQGTGEEMGQIHDLPETQHPLGPMTGSVGQMNSHDIVLAENETVDLDFDPNAPPAYDPKVAAFFDDNPAPQPGPVVEAEGTGPAWLMDGVAPTGSRVAGAQMTPWEQRDYIDEMGDARNSEKLQLGGTHYELDDLADSFLFGL